MMPHTITPAERLKYLLSAQKRQRSNFCAIEDCRERGDIEGVIAYQALARDAYLSIQHWRNDEA